MLTYLYLISLNYAAIMILIYAVVWKILPQPVGQYVIPLNSIPMWNCHLSDGRTPFITWVQQWSAATTVLDDLRWEPCQKRRWIPASEETAAVSSFRVQKYSWYPDNLNLHGLKLNSSAESAIAQKLIPTFSGFSASLLQRHKEKC